MKSLIRWGIRRRALISVLVLWCVIIGVFAIWWQQRSAQEHLVKELRKYGAEATWSRGGVLFVRFAPTKRPLGDKELRLLKGFPKILGVDLRNTNVSDVGLVHLDSLESLRFVCVSTPPISIQGIQRLQKNLPNAIIVRSRPEMGDSHLFPVHPNEGCAALK